MAEITLHNYEAFLLDHSEGSLDAETTAALKLFLVLHPELEINLDELSLPVLGEDATAFDLKHHLKKTEDDVPDELLLNYLEGNLSPEKHAAFENQLAADEELQKNLEDYRKTILQSDPAFGFDQKAALVKTEDEFIVSNRAIAYVEAQLNAAEKAEFEKELNANKALQQELAILLKTKLVADATVVYPNKAELKKEARVIALFPFRTVAAIAAAVLLLAGLFITIHVFDAQPVHRSALATNKTQTSAQRVGSIPQASTAARENDPVNVAATPKVPAHAIASANKKIMQKEEQGIVRKKPAEHEAESVSVAATEQQTLVKEEVIAETQSAALTETLAAEKNKPAHIVPDSSRQTNEVLVHHDVLETVEDTDDSAVATTETRFWKKAVKLAKRANQLGVRSVDGEERSGKSYFLSFNAFSVEKK